MKTITYLKEEIHETGGIIQILKMSTGSVWHHRKNEIEGIIVQLKGINRSLYFAAYIIGYKDILNLIPSEIKQSKTLTIESYMTIPEGRIYNAATTPRQNGQ
jgi:hypothetical protein